MLQFGLRDWCSGMTEAELKVILSDTSKRVDGDITWSEDADHSPSREFRANVILEEDNALFVKGSFNALAQTLSFAFIYRGIGRIYALDLGKDHHNPTCQYTGEAHKHRWTEKFRDKEAYVPQDIRSSAVDPVAVWKEFCSEAKLVHNGTMHAPPPLQMRMI